MSGPRSSLRPQDILIALKVKSLEKRQPWTQADMAKELGISPTEIAFALERLKNHSLLHSDKRNIKSAALFEFLVHGLKYVFPAQVGGATRGIPIGLSVPPLKGKIRITPEQAWVWPDSDGKARGGRIDPLYETVPFAVGQDTRLYQLLSLVDTIRVGGAREVALAVRALEAELINKAAM